MISQALVADLAKARESMPCDAWLHLTKRICGLIGTPNTDSIRSLTGELINRDAAWILSQAFLNNTAVEWKEIGATMTTVDCLNGDDRHKSEIIWSGPTNNRFPIRRIDQVLYDLISKAEKRIVLVTFAAYRVPILCERLAKAVRQGVALTLIVESEEESEGQLTRDAISAFGDIPLERTRIYYWPIDQRERNASGRPGKLHAKCAIVDTVALVSSANLTDDAFNRNIELGVILSAPPTVLGLISHFEELIHRKIFVEVKRH